MKELSNSKIVIGNLSTSGVTTLTATFDTKGFNYARIFCMTSSTHDVHTTAANNVLQESDDSTAGFTTITAASSGTGYTPTTATSVTTVARVVYDVPLQGRKRYLKVTFGVASTTLPSIIGILGQPADGVVTAAEVGTQYLSQPG